MPRLRDLGLRIHYEAGDGSLLASFVQPAVSASIRYDRLTGYFTVSSLISIAEGMEELWRRGGHMRLVLGIHDIPGELVDAVGPDWPDRVIESVRNRLLRGVSSLTDEFARDRVATIAWMMKDELLEVKVAAPVGSEAIATNQSIFHSKRLIFEDEAGDTVSAVGSPNETYGGLVANFEELTVHMSWSDPQGYVATHRDSFEKIWSGARPGLVVRPLDIDFADRLLDAASRPPRPPEAPLPSTYRALLEVVRQLPELAFVNLSNAALYPHQERAVLEALDRWPVRVLLADEVGLGKTLEAGAILAYMIRTNAVKRVLILAPKNVTRQWRDEMELHFGLDFWIYESGTRTYESATGRVLGLAPGRAPLGSGSPDLLIVSSQLARGRAKTADLLAAVDPPDLLLVDEAHSARVRADIDGSRRPTLMWRMLDRYRADIAHLVFLTATPMQLDWLEYFALLDLLGLPPDWTAEVHERSLRLLAHSGAPSLDQAAEALRMITIATSAYGGSTSTLGVLQIAGSAAARAVAAKQDWDRVFSTLVETHPASALTVRNSRRALERLGYAFPERSFSAPILGVPSPVRRFYEMVDVYLREAYGVTEQAASPDRAVQLGFVKSTYYQRLASSLTAARRTLERRFARLEAPLGSFGAEPGEPDEDEDDDGPTEDRLAAAGRKDVVERAARIERIYVQDLLTQLDKIESAGIQDPKLASLVEALSQYLERGDRVLVFSRYTDTVDACLAAFLGNAAQKPVGHAMYTGSRSWIDSGDGQVPATKEGVRKALEQARASIVFCSDAASEGLNLQAARVLINVDVPWNPARLEQRIGRIARLGQRASAVEIVNLWYPESVEAKMYGRLLARRDLYELAVGSLPEIVSDAIRSEVAARLGQVISEPADPIDGLQRVREDIQVRAIARVWDAATSPESTSSVRRSALLRLVGAHLARQGSAVERSDGRITFAEAGRAVTLDSRPGTVDAVSLRHPVFDSLRTEPTAPSPDEIVSVEVSGFPIALGVRRVESYWRLPPEMIPDAVSSALDGVPLMVPPVTSWKTAADFIEDATVMVVADMPTLPGRGMRRIPTGGEVPAGIALSSPVIRALGPIRTVEGVVAG
jgi:superfamily II DNA or RNA helicase